MKSEAVLLGTGTSNGVPSLGITYPQSFLDDPRNHRTRCSVLLRGPEGNVLIDCAPEMRLQLLRANALTLDATIITHTHADHIMGMDDLRSYCIRTGEPMPVYTLPPYQDDIRRVFRYAFEDFPPGIFIPRFDLRDVPPVLEISGLRIETRVVPHGPVSSLAIRVNDFAYLTDISAIPDEIRPWLEGLDVLVLDAVRFRPHPNHLHFDAAMAEAERIGARMTYFTHLCDEYDHSVFEATLPPHIRLAYDGLSIAIGN
ncbi:MAG: MBL fold metallo-hydrolase [Fimbriimonadaceae bacterium]|nr:MBL fold metallo-hydrolase [Fimbriimonadaceae bacterium]